MKKLLLGIVALIICIVAVYFFGIVNRYIFTSAPESGADFKIAHINAGGFTAVSPDSRSTVKMMLAAADSNDVDALFIQEYRPAWNFPEKDFIALARKHYPYVSVEDECAVLSKFPIISHERRSYADQSDRFSAVLLSVNGREVRVFAPHLRTTGLNYFGYGRDLGNASNASRARGMVRQNKQIRLAQAESLRDAVNYSLAPTIVAGDFNSLPWSRAMRKVMRVYLKDSFLKKGHGKGSTYRSMKDMARIDYILYDMHFECVDAEILPDELSDHRMITASFRFK